WPLIQQLEREREVLGLYVTGHPLDVYNEVVKEFGNVDTKTLAEITPDLKMNGKEFLLPCVVSGENHRMSKNGNPYGSFEVMDYKGTSSFQLFDKEYLELKSSLVKNLPIMLKIRVKDRRRPSKNPEEKFTVTYEYRAEKAELLSNVPMKMGSEIKLMVTPETLSSTATIEALMQMHKQEGVRLKVMVEDTARNMRSELESSKLKLVPDNE